MSETIKQCRSCPWRVDCSPVDDIPNGYSEELHRALSCTIASPGSLRGNGIAMACHYSKPGEEFACAGWLYHQLGRGNNIALRLCVISGQMPAPEIDGEQHETFEDTLS